MAEFAPLLVFGEGGTGSFGFTATGGTFTDGGAGSFAFDAFGTSIEGGAGSFGFRGAGGTFDDGGFGSFTFTASGSSPLPPIEVSGGGGSFGFGVTGIAITGDFSDATGSVGFNGVGGTYTDGGYGSFGFDAFGSTETEEPNALWLFQSPGNFYMTFGFQLVSISEGLSLAHTTSSVPRWIARSAIDVGADPSSLLSALHSVSDGFTANDLLGIIFRMFAASGFTLAGDAIGSALIVGEVIDAIALTGGAGSTIEAANAVASAMALEDAMARIAPEQISDQAVFGTAYGTALTARQAQISALQLAAIPTNTATMTSIVNEGLQLAESTGSILEAVNTIRDGIGMLLTVHIGDTVYRAWVCNTETKAFSNYENYPFNSFFEMHGVYYGVADTGIYELTGDTDAGEPIVARVRTGLWNLNTGKMKRIPSLYLGYSASGRLVLKVITTSDTGDKDENWYELSPTNASAMREGRMKIGRGLKSVYWGFEITNIDGADFTLDSIELFPMILDRRIQGDSDGN